MATAEELLRSMALQPDPEGHIVVGGDRFITVPDNLKRLGVQYDHNMETVTFDCPRYWDKRDMSQMAVYICYMLANGYADRYPADNVRADGDIMHFDWTISGNVTQVAGAVSFLVCVMKTDSEGNEERHWNSELCSECYISQGMETKEHPALKYPDEVTQLLLRMATVEQINVQAQEMRQLLTDTQEVASTAQEVKEQALDASGYIKNSYAPAIKGNVSGEVIRVDDVSLIEHDVKCQVHGKNLFDVSKLSDITGKLTNNNDGTLTITANQYAVPTGIKLKKLCPSMRAGHVYTLSFVTTSEHTKYVWLQGANTMLYNATYTFTDEMLDSELYLYGFRDTDAGYGGVCTISNIQIEEGSVATPYESYIDPSTVTLKRFGKNLLNPNRGSSSGKGLTLTNNGNGSFTISGTATAAASFGLTNLTSDPLYLYKGVTYTQSVDVLAGSMNGVAIVPSVEDDDGNVTWNYFSNNQTKTPQKHYKFWGYEVYVENGKTVDLTFRVQLEVGETATDYEPYKTVSMHTPSSDGTCIVTSKSPTTTLFTDTPGVTIEAEYNRDTAKVFESYVLTDEAKQEIANIVLNLLKEA